MNIFCFNWCIILWTLSLSPDWLMALGSHRKVRLLLCLNLAHTDVQNEMKWNVWCIHIIIAAQEHQNRSHFINLWLKALFPIFNKDFRWIFFTKLGKIFHGIITALVSYIPHFCLLSAVVKRNHPQTRQRSGEILRLEADGINAWPDKTVGFTFRAISYQISAL